MKKLKQKQKNRFIATMMMIAGLAPPLAFAQADHGGRGGDVQRSTIQDVIKVIKRVKAEPTNPVWSQDRMGYWIESDSVYRDFFEIFTHFHEDTPLQRSLFEKPLDQIKFFDTPVYQDLKRTKIQILTSGKCPNSDPNEKNISASTERHLGASICVDAKALSTLPKADLLMQIRALLAHEIVHHFGFGEEEANQVQQLVLEINQKTVETSSMRLRESTQMIQMTLERITKRLKSANTTDSALCMDIGIIVGMYQDIQDLDESYATGTERETGHLRSKISCHEWQKFTDATGNLASFCGYYYLTSNEWSTTVDTVPDPAKFGNRDYLKSSLLPFKSVFIGMYEKITGFKWSPWND